MNFPVEITIGDLSISLHLIMEVLAFAVGYQFYLHLRKGSVDQISGDNRFIIIVGAALGALLGSRLLGALENPVALFQSKASAPELLLAIYQSKTIVGGLLGGLFGVELTKKLIGVKHSSGDLFTFPIILGMILGRIGCFSMGIHEPTYGFPTKFFTGLDLGDGVLRHPTALYEIVILTLLFLFLWPIYKHKRMPNGSVFQLFMVGYLLYRLLVGFIQPREYVFFTLGSLQIACLFGLAYYGFLFLKRNRD